MIYKKFTGEVDYAYLGEGEEVVVVGKYHWLTWVMPLFALAALGFLYIAYGKNTLAIAATVFATTVFLKRQFFHHTKAIFVGIGVALIAVVAEMYDGFIVWLIGATMAYAAYRWIEYIWTTFTLTDCRLVRQSGIFTTQTATMNLRALTDIRLEEPILGSLFGYGHFKVESAGQQQAFTRLRYIPMPERFYRLVMTVACGDVKKLQRVGELPSGWNWG